MAKTIVEIDPDDTVDSVRLTGHIKWFDTTKGYGFVIPENTGNENLHQDIMLHVSCLQAYGAETADEGARIVCDVVERSRGWQVAEIIEMEDSLLSLALTKNQADVYEQVFVKWFNPAQGFGFVNRTTSPEDIFIHVSVMRKAGLEDLSPGAALDVVIGEGRKGLNVLLIREKPGTT